MRRRIRFRALSKLPRVSLLVDRLERRDLLRTVPSVPSVAGLVAHPMFDVAPLVSNTSPPPGAYTPAQIQTAYGFNKITFGSVKGDGTGQTIAIVDAQDDPNIQADLNAFDTQFGLPNTTVTRVSQTGSTTYPAADSTGGWELEESLDVEWAHGIAPGAKILLVEANSANDSDLLAAVDYGSAHANVVSMSWGGSEFSGENYYDSHFTHSGVSYVASSGDYGAPISWPAASPDVLAVGGTSLYLGSSAAWSSETGWSGSGGGPSAYESQPAYQVGVVTQTSTRANPDVAYDASSSTGFSVYNSYPYSGTSYGWMQIGGTSAGAPQWAAMLAIADQGRALNGQVPLASSNPQEVASILYQSANRGDFHDITSGTSTGTPNYSAGPGYDYVTGLGSPLANLVVQSLDGTVTPVANDHLVVSASTVDTAGTAFSVTVTAQNSTGATDSSYRGTIQFTSTDGQAALPANYTFTSADAGSHTFTVTLKTAGSQSLTATDTVSSTVTGTLSGITVSPAAASQFILAGLPSSTTVGTSQTVTVTAKDAYGNVATGYGGTVHFTSSDASATLPANYTFTAADRGTHSFTLAFQTAGSQSVTVSDVTTALSASQSGISVSPAAPLSLTAIAASTSQINLSWSGSSGATSYLIERSTSPSSGWAQIGTTGAGVTSYQDSGLTAGTAYYYRVRASGGSLTSAYSNTASATTQGTVTTASDTLWSNSYVPSENSYASGSYEVGVKFRTDVAGTVTGVRFYKQTWMGGYSHVGHLWSSTGVLLATASFTNETSYGWQQVSFSSPVTISPNTVYIISFSTGGGYFGISTSFFSTTGVDSGPLHALANGVSGGDGVYGYAGAFPTTSGSGMNFWADVVFSPSSTTSAARPASVAAPTGVSSSSNVVPLPSSGPQANAAVEHARAVSHPTSALGLVAWSSRRTVAQAATSEPWRRTDASWSGF